MVRPRSLLPALAAATVASILPWITLPGITPSATAAPAAPAAPVAETKPPLALTIDRMTPSVLGRKGPVTLTGTVTNVSDETWRSVAVYPFASWHGLGPRSISTPEQLASEMELADDEYAGERFTGPDNFVGTIPELDPGDSQPYVARITAEEAAAVTAEGVYWIGVHAIGQSDSSPRDGVADGRARTFIPLVDDAREAVQTATVLSLRGRVGREPDGRIAPAKPWGDSLRSGGQLDNLVHFGSLSTQPVSWLIDPAVVNAIQELGRGNTGWPLGANLPESGEPETPGDSASPSASGSASASLDPAIDPDTGESDQTSSADQAIARDARAFLNAAGDALIGQDLLLLPWADVDVEAALDHDAAWLRRAVTRSGESLVPWGLSGRPVVAPLDGRVTAETLRALPPSTLALANETTLQEPGPALVTVDGRPVVIADSTVVLGGPGPGDARAPVAMRQQILAEGALRALGGGESMVTVFPGDWRAPSTDAGVREFFAGLDVPWLEPVTLTDIESGEAPEADVKADRRITRLDGANFAAAQHLLDAGRLLDDVLYRNDQVTRAVEGEALSTLSSYADRQPARAWSSSRRATDWIHDELDRIRIEPTSVLLSSEQGSFNVTVVNGTDHPVEIQVVADSDDDVEIAPSRLLRLQPGDRSTQLMQVSSGKLGNHHTRLYVATKDGTPVGSNVLVPVRVNQVSQVIWVIVAIGGVLLGSTILLRLFRRVRNFRRTRRDRNDSPAADEVPTEESAT